MQLLFEFQHANAILNSIFAGCLWLQSLWNRQWIQVSFQQSRRSIFRLSNRMAAHSVSVDAIRKDQARYRCGAKFEEIAPVLGIHFTSGDAQIEWLAVKQLTRG